MELNLDKLPTDGTYWYTPSFEVKTTEGLVSNKEQPPADQIKVKLKRPNMQEREAFNYQELLRRGGELSRRLFFEYEPAITKYCIEVKGLEKYGIKDGKTLYKVQQQYPILEHLVGEIFTELCQPSDGTTGELSEGE